MYHGVPTGADKAPTRLEADLVGILGDHRRQGSTNFHNGKIPLLL